MLTILNRITGELAKPSQAKPLNSVHFEYILKTGQMVNLIFSSLSVEVNC